MVLNVELFSRVFISKFTVISPALLETFYKGRPVCVPLFISLSVCFSVGCSVIAVTVGILMICTTTQQVKLVIRVSRVSRPHANISHRLSQVKIDLIQEWHHRLRGSASPVLTATGFVNGKGQFSTPHRIDTPQPITKIFVTGDYVGNPYSCAKLGAYPSMGASGHMGEI